jgi:GR25 family glycosyltransferase involved in LPS biosynthesis
MINYVITIFELEESVKVAERCIQSGKKFNINIDKFEACTPQDNPREYLESEGIDYNNIMTRVSRSDNVLSCFVSHYQLWKKCVKLNEEITIFEHDAVIKSNIPNDLDYKGCINLGQPSWGRFNIPKRMGVNKLSSKDCFPGAHAYRIKPECANEMIEKSKKYAKPVDTFLNNENFNFLEEYYPWPVIADDYFTTVQKNNGTRGKNNYRKLGNKYRII